MTSGQTGDGGMPTQTYQLRTLAVYNHNTLRNRNRLLQKNNLAGLY